MANTLQHVAWIGQSDAAAHRSKLAQCAGVDVKYLDLHEFADAKAKAGFDAVISACASEAELRDVALGPHGVLRSARPGLVYIDTSHVSEELSREIAALAQSVGVRYLRAPITKGPASGDEVPAYTAMVSGPQEVFDVARFLVEDFSQKVFYLGQDEEARAMTRVLDVMSGVTLAMWAEALVFGEAVGLDWIAMLNVMETSAIGSPLIQDHAAHVAKRDFASSPRCGEMTERLAGALKWGKSSGVVLTLTGLAHQMYLGALGQSGVDADRTAIIPYLESACGQRASS
jgi:3-hydroxyisobutyrate dehydrogenase-like beta-hydroxyacid dehydrogenase